jgi:hypothetical protein
MLILHVGLPRCASTSLQLFFAQSNFCKYPSPILYPSTGVNSLTGDYGHSTSLRYTSVNEHSLFVESSLEADLLKELSDLSSLEAPILISSEDLWRSDPADICASLRDVIDVSTVKIVAIRRPWLEWIFSLYCHNQNLLADQGISFMTWTYNVALDISYMRSIGKHSMYDHDRLGCISKCFNDSLSILPFPGRGNTLRALAEVAGLDRIPESWDKYGLSKLNSSIPLKLAMDPASSAGKPDIAPHELAMHILYNVSSITYPLPSVENLVKQIDNYIRLLS